MNVAVMSSVFLKHGLSGGAGGGVEPILITADSTQYTIDTTTLYTIDSTNTTI